MSDDDVPTPELARSLGLGRRQFLAATTAMAAAGTVAGVQPARGLRRACRQANGTVVPPAKRGIILYTVRDADLARPEHLAYASGFKEVFGELGRIGYSQIEFAGYNQSRTPRAATSTPSRAPAAAVLARRQRARGRGQPRQHPDDHHEATIAAFDAPCEIANILGMGHIGTGSDPTNSAHVADWAAAAERWNFLGERAASHGLKLYTHNHDIAYSFLLDSGPLDAQGRPTRSSGSGGSSTSSRTPTRSTSSSRWTSTGRTSRSTSTRHTRRRTAAPSRRSSTRSGSCRRRPSASRCSTPRTGRTTRQGPTATTWCRSATGDIDYSTFLSQVGAKGYAQPDVGAGQRTGWGRRPRSVARRTRD